MNAGWSVVHIRPAYFTEQQLGFPTLCGVVRAGESISYEHFHEHVRPNVTDCCAALAARLCDPCVARAHEIHITDEGGDAK